MTPSTETRPESGRSIAAITLSRVLLPQPDGPVIATTSPGAARKETSRRARIRPAKVFDTRSTSTAAPRLPRSAQSGAPSVSATGLSASPELA